MKFLHFASFILVSLFIHSSESVNIDCTYREFYYTSENHLYGCLIEGNLDINSPEDALVYSVTGTHIQGYSDEDVEDFEVTGKNIRFIPSGLGFYFRNLRRLRIQNSGVQEISQGDLEQFPKLTHLDLRNNQISKLDEGLFDKNPNLISITFNSNRISYIYPNSFDNLFSLNHLQMLHNPCINAAAHDDSTALQETIQAIKDNCKA